MAIENDIISYTQARNNFKALMDKVWDDATPVIITRGGGRPVVMMNKDEYDSLNTTEYLMRSKANRAALDAGIAEVKSRKTVAMKLTKSGKLVRAD